MVLTVTKMGQTDLALNSPQNSELVQKMVFASIEFDASYATGGEAITAADFGLDILIGLKCIAQDSEEYYCVYDAANGKIAVLDVDSETAGSVDLTGLNPIFVAFGR